MLDPDEGIAADGTITTGVSRQRVPPVFEPALQQIAEQVGQASLWLYGSVATGQARLGVSDLDLLAIGLDEAKAAQLSQWWSAQLAGVVRGVEINGSSAGLIDGESDEAYGNRVFLRHYCVPLTGIDLAAGWPPYPADVRAARGFNGDIAMQWVKWREALHKDEIHGLSRRMARKTLLALTGLVSVHDGIWTTDRLTAAERWSLVRPEMAAPLSTLVRWSEKPSSSSDSRTIQRMMDDVVSPIVEDFSSVVGLWSSGARA